MLESSRINLILTFRATFAVQIFQIFVIYFPVQVLVALNINCCYPQVEPDQVRICGRYSRGDSGRGAPLGEQLPGIAPLFRIATAKLR